MNRVVIFLSLLLVIISVAGCSSRPAVMDYERLADSLRKGGATVETGEDTFPFDEKRPIFSVDVRNIEINGENISVLEYDDEATARTETEIISPDGFGFTTPDFAAQVDWIAPPHFYRSGRIIVLYVGRNQVIIDLLNSILGPQFAGDM